MAIRLRRQERAITLVLGLAVLLPAAAQAQKVASTFDELQGRVLLGETVKVVDGNGQATRGKLIRLTATDLTVSTAGREQTISGADIAQVRARRSGPLWNGAVIGAAVPAVILGVVLASDDCYDCNIGPGAFLPIGMGAAIGVGIDALVKGDVTVMKRSSASARKISVMPVLSRDRRGVLCAIRF